MKTVSKVGFVVFAIAAFVQTAQSDDKRPKLVLESTNEYFVSFPSEADARVWLDNKRLLPAVKLESKDEKNGQIIISIPKEAITKPVDFSKSVSPDGPTP